MHSPQLNELPAPPAGKTGWPWTAASDPQPKFLRDESAWPKISVVTPSYNQGQFIEETIRSVLLQGYPNLEFIIIDGGSTDNTLDVIKKYEHWISYWVSEPDNGQGNAINKGLKKTTGDILFWLNSDDIVLPKAFSIVGNIFLSDPTVLLISGQANVINSIGETTGMVKSYFYSWEELITNPGNSIRQISTFFSRQLYEEVGSIDEDLDISLDKELMALYSMHTTPLVIQDVLSAFRAHQSSKTGKNLLAGYMETDRSRKRLLRNSSLRKVYRRRSSDNWVRLSQNKMYSDSERKSCLKEALLLYPMNGLTRKYWFSLWKLIIHT